MFAGLVSQRATDENDAHGFLVVPLAAWFAWEKRGVLRALPLAPDPAGIAVLVADLALLVAGSVGGRFLQRLSVVVVLAGLVWLTAAGSSPRSFFRWSSFSS